MINIVLFEPEIPQNTGNIMRTCVATNSKLHLIKPLGFSLDEKYIKRSGVNYIPFCDYQVYDNLDDYDYKSLYPNIMMQTNVGSHAQIGRIYINSEMNGVENKYNNSIYFRGGSFLDDFHSNNWLEFCNRWLYLASYDDLLDDVIRYNT